MNTKPWYMSARMGTALVAVIVTVLGHYGIPKDIVSAVQEFGLAIIAALTIAGPGESIATIVTAKKKDV